jgi:hypothetical protein
MGLNNVRSNDMSRSLIAPILPALIAASQLLSVAGHADGSAQAPPNASVAVVDFDYRDTSGEERDQRQEHETRLRDFMTALRSDLAARGKVIVSPKCDPTPCSMESPAAELLRAAREAGAGVLLVGTVQKTSTLIQWAKAEAIDTGTERIVLDKLFTFRGDNDESWRRAESFIADQLAPDP